MWHHDYLHLRPLAEALRERLGAAGARTCALDLGCGTSPYRRFAPGSVDRWVRLDLARDARPDVVARAEALPFRDASFDLVLSTQTLGLVEDPEAVGREIARVLRPGGRALLTAPAAWPYDSARVEHRLGAPQLARLLPGLEVGEIAPQGGMLGLPFALGNGAVREAVRAAERRLGPAAFPLRAGARVVYVVANAAGRLLEALASRGPLAAFLGYLDRRLPVAFLLDARKPAR